MMTVYYLAIGADTAYASYDPETQTKIFIVSGQTVELPKETAVRLMRNRPLEFAPNRKQVLENRGGKVIVLPKKTVTPPEEVFHPTVKAMQKVAAQIPAMNAEPKSKPPIKKKAVRRITPKKRK